MGERHPQGLKGSSGICDQDRVRLGKEEHCEKLEQTAPGSPLGGALPAGSSFATPTFCSRTVEGLANNVPLAETSCAACAWDLKLGRGLGVTCSHVLAPQHPGPSSPQVSFTQWLHSPPVCVTRILSFLGTRWLHYVLCSAG